MRTVIGITAALLLLAGMGSGCTAATAPTVETAHVWTARAAQAHDAGAAAAQLPQAWQRAEDARDIAFYSERIPGYRSAEFNE